MKRMAVVEWTSDLRVGIAVIDHEHHKLVARLNKIQAAIPRGTDSNELSGMFHDFVISYEESIDEEDDLLDHTLYPKAKAHAAAHESLAAHILNVDWQAISGKTKISTSVLQHVAALLVDHIKGPDREFAEFYRSVHDG